VASADSASDSKLEIVCATHNLVGCRNYLEMININIKLFLN